jgi:hypothetical protein
MRIARARSGTSLTTSGATGSSRVWYGVVVP